MTTLVYTVHCWSTDSHTAGIWDSMGQAQVQVKVCGMLPGLCPAGLALQGGYMYGEEARAAVPSARTQRASW